MLGLNSKHSIMDNQQEIFPLVDEDGKVIGSATRGDGQAGIHAQLRKRIPALLPTPLQCTSRQNR